LSAGSNLGERMTYLDFAVSWLREAGKEIRASAVYETQPVGFDEQPWFLNIAVELQTSMAALDLLECCRRIEEAAGRTREIRWGPRTLDLDILLYGDCVVHEPNLSIPHPRMAERRFVLRPLADIAPDAVHPVLNKTVRKLLDSCPDPAIARLYSGGSS
jgi:2-amino-4-hydroxy-6-hydroxymethyldihydropteridine diphosphokinase